MFKVLNIFIVLSMVIASALHAEPVVSVPDGILGVTGEVVTAPIETDDATGLLGFDCIITYDTTLLDLSGSDIKTGSLTAGWSIMPNVNDAIGWAKVIVFTASEPLTGGSGSLLEFDFHVIGTSGTSDLGLSGMLNEDEIPALYDSGSILVASGPPIPGDANVDNRVDDADALILSANWLAGPSATWGMGDFNGDGYVTDFDATVMAANWQASTAATGSVPEPGMTVLLIGALLPLLLWQIGWKTYFFTNYIGRIVDSLQSNCLE